MIAKFIGENNLLHLKNGKCYDIEMIRGASSHFLDVSIKDGSMKIPCSYESLENFLDNWDVRAYY